MTKKSYLEQMQEITAENLFDGFLGFGLFAEKISPFLSSEAFLDFSKTAKESIFEKNDKGYIQYENIRNINIPRLLAIPEPIAYRNLCKCLSENWGKLIEHFEKYTATHEYKISRIHIRKIKDTKVIFEMGDYGEIYELEVLEEKKHLFEMSHKNFYEDDYPEPHLLIGKSYQVSADISNCFPSIYTHSIPWALVGKAHSKLHKTGADWFNDIDRCIRNLKSQETHGILIGPHASNLLSEIILVVIDDELYEKGYRFIRNIDDYTCFVESNEKAEQFLIDLANSLKNFNLSLNHKKTEITKLPLASSKNWKIKLNSDFSINDKATKKLISIRNYLDTAVDLMQKNNHDSAILNYAIKVISNKKLFPNALDYYLSYIHHLILIYPYLIILLDDYVFKALDVPKDKIEKISSDIFKMGKDKNVNEAMSYALYFAVKYNFNLGTSVYETVKDSKDCVVLVLAYLHDKKYLKKTLLKPYKDLAEQLNLNDFDEYWLFIYEVLAKDKLTKYWKKMKESKVSFIKADFRV
jgi:hypothetical protein